MKSLFLAALAAALAFPLPALAAEAEPEVPAITPAGKKPRIKPKNVPAADGDSLLQPDVSVIDAPTTAVLDYGGYAAQSRFFARGGLLQFISFGVFQNVNLGGSLTLDGLVGDDRDVRLRAPNVQFKWRFYDGDRSFPSVALGFDGQGYDWNSVTRRFNQRQRGFFIVASQELGLPGFQVHPSFNVSDFDSNQIYGSIPLSLNIKDKVSIVTEWDNINNFRDSRYNAGLRAYVTPRFHVDFAVRAIGAGGRYSNGDPRGPERIVQLRYSNNF